MAATSTNMISALGAGSGVDVKALAQSLVDSQKVPQTSIIEAKISKNEAKISGYGAISYVVGELKAKFAALDETADFSSAAVSSSSTSSFSATASSLALTGNHDIQVLTLAKPQRSLTGGWADATTALSTDDIDFTLVGSATAGTLTVAAASSSPTGIVSAINAANLGVTAQLVYTGSGSTPYQIMLTSDTGTANAFSMTSADSNGDVVTGLEFSTTTAAVDATLTVDGVTLTRSSNTVDDAIDGITLELKSVLGSSEILTLSQDSSAIKTKIKELVAAYNDVNTVLNDVSNKDSPVEGYGGSLPSESTVSMIRSQIRSIFISDTSVTTSGSITALRDLGITITRSGTMELDETTLDSALNSSLDDVVSMLSNDRSKATTNIATESGLAGNAVKTLNLLIKTGGTVTNLYDRAKTNIADFKKDLAELDERMTRLLERYTKQFAAMESIVGQSNSLRASIKSNFDAMVASKD